MEYKNNNYITKFKLLFIFVLSWIECILTVDLSRGRSVTRALKLKSVGVEVHSHGYCFAI